MPRTARASIGGICYHVINRGNARAQVFHDDADFETFTALLQQGYEPAPMRVVDYCLMPSHFHLILWPHEDGDLGRYMQWLLTSHVRRHHRRHATTGHVWQGRFKAFPVQTDHHLLTVSRYVQRNPLRANLVPRAQDWPWSSLALRRSNETSFLHPGPVDAPKHWLRLVNSPQTDRELKALRQSVNRGAPFGSETWVRRTAARLGLQAAIHPRGRPRKPSKK